MITDILELGFKFLDKIIVDPVERSEAKRKLIEQQQLGAFKEDELRYGAIGAEAGSADPWTSRARPSFMYVFYTILFVLVLIAPFVGIFFPSQMAQFYVNVAAGFKAIPEALWATFTVGYLGYAYARTTEKKAGVA